MARIDVPYLISKPGRKGPDGKPVARYFWQPSTALRKAGWRAQRLPDDLAQAIERAKEINLGLDAWRQGAEAQALSPTDKMPPAPDLVRPGTVAHLIRRYRESRFYTEKEKTTKRGYDQNLVILENWGGDELVRDIDAEDIQTLYDQFRHKTPAKAAAIIRMARILFRCSVRFGMRTDNPAEKPGLEGAAPSGKLWPKDAIDLFVEAADKLGWHSVGTSVVINHWIGQRQVIAHVVGERSCVGTLDMSQPMYEAAHPLSLE